MLVLKFGGTSVGSPKAIRSVYEIVKDINETKVVVVSAMSGVTDNLIKCFEKASIGDESYKEIFKLIYDKHRDAMLDLLGFEVEGVKELFSELQQILFAIFKIKDKSEKANALVQSFGERLNARIVSSFFKSKGMKSTHVDASNIIVTTSNYLDANPIYEESKKRVDKVLSRYLKEGFVTVVTGYIGSDLEGNITTLGRGGSDFTATILGYLLDAREVFIYTDVDGVLTADPKIVKEAKTIPKLSFSEVRELSYFGAKVMHSKSLIPATEKNIPIRVLNTFNPKGPFTIISNETEFDKAKAVTAIKDVNLISVKGKGIQGVKGISKRVFEVASYSNTNIIMIAQTSSEQTIDLFVKASESENFLKNLKEEFKEEIKLNLIDEISTTHNLSIISIVGDGITKQGDIVSSIFKICNSRSVRVYSSIQGSSETSFSIAVKTSSVPKLVNAIHSELGLAGKKIKEINIFQFGVGGVGSNLIELIKERKEYIEENYGIRLNYIGLARSNSYAIFDDVKYHIENKDFNFKKTNLNLEILKSLPKNTVFVDVTNSFDLKNTLLELVSLGYNVVTSNKKNLTEDYESFLKLTQNKGKFLFETTVGATLPIIKTIKDFKKTAQIKKIVALPSGTLSYIFFHVNNGMSLKDAILKAVNLGYTEPNPVDDLVFFDILRKGKILSYLIGKNFLPNEIEFKCLTKATTLEEFFEKEEKNVEEQIKNLSKDGVVYPVVEIEDKLKIGLKALSKDSSFATLQPGENIFEIYLEGFSLPVIIRGLGAGLRYTAMGVLQDILSLEAYIWN